MTNLVVANVNNVGTEDVANYRISSIRVRDQVEKAVAEADIKEREAKGKTRRSKLMPTTPFTPDPMQTPSGLSLLNNPLVSKVLSGMSTGEKVAFINELSAFVKSVNDVKAAMANVKDQTKPTDKEQNEITNAALVVKERVGRVTAHVKDPSPHLSIWYLLANFMANDIMKINQKEESAAMYQVQANADTLDRINERLAQINPKLDQAHHTDTFKSILFSVGCLLVGILLCFVNPVLGGIAIAGAVAVGIAFPVCNDEDSGKSQADARFSFLQDNSASGQQLQEASVEQSFLSNLGTQVNQGQQTTMQLHVTQTSQIISQVGEEFSQMIQYAAQTANTSTR